jgi:hypothetical protein
VEVLCTVVAADTDCQIHVKYPKISIQTGVEGRPMHQNSDPNDRAMVDDGQAQLEVTHLRGCADVRRHT